MEMVCNPLRCRSGVVRPASNTGEHGEYCSLCLPSPLEKNQILMVTEHLYLLAPRGQIMEGYLSINTRQCGDTPIRLRCLDDLPDDWIGELHRAQDTLVAFYRDVYRSPPTFYEHGRGGGTRRAHVSESYPFHPHLCAAPGNLEIHGRLESQFDYIDGVTFPHVREVVGPRAYLYVDTPGDAARARPRAYFTTADEDEVLQTYSIKKSLVLDNALSGEWDWRAKPTEPALDRVIAKFARWQDQRSRLTMPS